MASPKSTFQTRARSVPYKRPLVKALIFTTIFYASVVAMLVAVVVYMMEPESHAAMLFGGLAGLTLFTWLLSFFARRKAKCMLCQGTPYLDSGAHVHQKAWKLPVLNYGNTNVLRSLFTLHFRCMFCGTLYDYLKPVSNPLPWMRKKPKKQNEKKVKVTRAKAKK